MAGVLQSGNVTPGHLAGWVTDGVIGDLGAAGASQKVLGSLRGADFNSTGDQPILLPQSVLAFTLTGVIVTNCSAALSTAAGGFYTQSAKGGSQLVSSATTYAQLALPSDLASLTLTVFSLTTRLSSATLGNINGLLAIWLSLTTPQGVSANADVYALGVDLS